MRLLEARRRDRTGRAARVSALVAPFGLSVMSRNDGERVRAESGSPHTPTIQLAAQEVSVPRGARDRRRRGPARLPSANLSGRGASDDVSARTVAFAPARDRTAVERLS